MSSITPESSQELVSNSLVVLLALCLIVLPQRVQALQLRHEDQVLDVVISEEFSPAMQVVLIEWLDDISNALLQVYGQWPRRRWEIAVTAVSTPPSDPIPWGEVHRGEVDRVDFYIARTATADALRRTWTSYHELSHLLIPYRGWGDLWFSEGLASYYQNILQARVGVLDEQQMWQKLYEGFMRGRAQTQFDGIDLQTMSKDLHKSRGFMRVYWSGAWYFLTADVALRRQSLGELNLDKALAVLNRCCADQKMSVVDMVRKLDELNELNLFYPLYLKTIASSQVPPFEELFTSLGIDLNKQLAVSLQENGPGARLRRQITARKVL